MQPKEGGGQVRSHGAVEKPRDDRLFPFSRDEQQDLAGLQDVADAERQSVGGLRLHRFHYGVLERFPGQLRDVATGLQGGTRFVQSDMAVFPEPENAQIDRPLALQLDLHSRAVKFVSIAGNDDILVTAIVPAKETPQTKPGRVLTSLPVLTSPDRTRLTLTVPVSSLADVMTTILSNGGQIERIYDY